VSDGPFIPQSTVQNLVVPDDGWIRRYVDCYSGHVEVPDEAFAGTAYTLLSSVIGWKSYLQWADATEPLTLYTALIGASATAHKTTSLSIAERIARDANVSYLHHRGVTIDDEDNDNLLKVITGGHMSQARLLDLLGPKDADQAYAWERSGAVPPCHLLVWDELKDLLVQDKGYSFLGETRQMLLRIYSGFQPGSQTRTNYVRPGRCSMAMMGTVTMATWRDQLGEEAVSSGMMGRLLAIPYGRPPHWVPLPSAVDPAKRAELVQWLVELGNVHSDSWGPVELDPEATDYWVAWYTAHKNEIARLETKDATKAAAQAALFGRYQATALKFAGVQTVSRWNPGDGVPRVRVGADTLKSACAYIDHVMRFSVPVATEALEDREYRHQRRVTDYVVSNGPVSFTDLQRAVRTRGITADRFRRLVELLHDEGQMTLSRETRGGREILLVSPPEKEAEA
jgi:hypothetical protein